MKLNQYSTQQPQQNTRHKLRSRSQASTLPSTNFMDGILQF